METTIFTSVTGAVTDINNALSTVTGWWFIPVVVGIFGASLTISLVGSFFGKRRGRRRR